MSLMLLVFQGKRRPPGGEWGRSLDHIMELFIYQQPSKEIQFKIIKKLSTNKFHTVKPLTIGARWLCGSQRETCVDVDTCPFRGPRDFNPGPRAAGSKFPLAKKIKSINVNSKRVNIDAKRVNFSLQILCVFECVVLCCSFHYMAQ